MSARLTFWVMVLALVLVSFLPKGTMLAFGDGGPGIELCTPGGMVKSGGEDSADKLCAFALHQSFSIDLTPHSGLVLLPLDLRDLPRDTAISDLVPQKIKRPTWAQGPPILL